MPFTQILIYPMAQYFVNIKQALCEKSDVFFYKVHVQWLKATRNNRHDGNNGIDDVVMMMIEVSIIPHKAMVSFLPKENGIPRTSRSSSHNKGPRNKLININISTYPRSPSFDGLLPIHSLKVYGQIHTPPSISD